MNKKTIWTLVIVVVVVVIIGWVWYSRSDMGESYSPPPVETSTVTVPTSTPTSTVTQTSTPPVTQTNSSTPSNATTVTNPTPTSSLALPIEYQNSTYGFVFLLPIDWQGFTVLQKEWQGNGQTGIVATGTEIIIRNPNWTANDHYEDIPVLVFTTAQWNAYQAGNFNVSAAPILATELNANNKYVFALPPRWDYDYSTGYQEADRIVAESPLRASNL